MEELARAEIERLTTLLSDLGVSDKRIEIMSTVIENTAWMKVKLDEAREVVRESSVVISYDNGGGQKGIRENPIFKGYESLWKSYMQGMQKIIDCIPSIHEEVKKVELEKPRTTLELIRAKKQA